MASLGARTTHTSPCWSGGVAGIWRNVGRLSSSSVLQSWSCSDAGQDALVPRSPSAAHPLSGKFSPIVPKTQRFGDFRPVYDWNSYPRRKWEGFGVYRTPPGVPTKKFTRTASTEEERPLRNSICASGNVAQEPRHDSLRQGFASGVQLPIDSACEIGSIHLPSASSTTAAIAILKHRQERGQSIDPYMFVEILKRCSKQKDLVATRVVHDYLIQIGMHKDRYVVTILLDVYVKCGRLQDARQVFDGLETNNRNVVTWNVMIGGYAKSGRGMEAYRLFLQMKGEGFIPDAFTYASLLNPSASAGGLEWVKKVHDHVRGAGLESHLRVSSALVHMYAKSGSIGDARLVFDRMQERNVIIWNTMIGGYAESGDGVEAYQLFLQMKREGFRPDAYTYTSILNATANAGAFEWVKQVHGHAREGGLESDLRVGNALVHMYAKIGNIDEARLVFDRIAKRDVITWNIMIGGYAESGCGMEAYRLFLSMNREGFTPDAYTYLNILNACASAGALEWVKDVHDHGRRAGLTSDVRVGNALIHTYAKSGSISDARRVFDTMEKRNVITWNTIIGGYAQHGCGHEALKLFKKMNADCAKPDGNSFVAVLSACSHAGLIDDGRRLFLAMKQDYSVDATVVHCTCMVDLLGRAGHLKEAKHFIDTMPVKPNGVTWTTFLGACRTYGNVELGEFAAEEALKLEPQNSSAYVLLSNIYAAAGKWDKVSSVRTMMHERGVRKEPGVSWIEVDDKIHEFVVGDTSHPEANAIYSELKKLTEKLKAKGYVPDTKLVTLNIDEEEKELALCSHSEKVAIAYGLLRVPREKPIHVMKNLRICSDCHAATKLISEVIGRGIIVRDAIRFHHFKDGVCSCGDYW